MIDERSSGIQWLVAMVSQLLHVIAPPATRLRVGSFFVDIDRREVTRPDVQAPCRITVKAAHVLLVLVVNAGKVVTREQLLNAVWAGTMPTLDVVTQAIASLRRAFEDDANAPSYIRTIPKSGYFLLATVEWLPELQSENTRDVVTSAAVVRPVPAFRSNRWRRNLFPAAAVIALICTILLLAGWHRVNLSESALGEPESVSDAAMSSVRFAGATTVARGVAP